MSMSRRDFLKTGLQGAACLSLASTVPAWITKSAHAFVPRTDDGRILVIVQLAGGIDGLNTVIPYTDEDYNGPGLRPTLHITSGLEGTTIDSLNAFHPKLIRLKDWYTDGKVAVVQNVGYPNPDLSHFVATDFWEFGTSPGSQTPTTDGWVARYVDNVCAGTPPEDIDPLSMLAAGMFRVPATMDGSALYTPPAVGQFDFYNIFVPGDDLQAVGDHYLEHLKRLNNMQTLDANVDFVQRAANLAQSSVEDMQTASGIPLINPYPLGSLGSGLDMASKVIRAGFPTRVFYVSQGGYDTHANQIAAGDPIHSGDHARLLDTFDQAIDAFLNDMASSGNLDRVTILTFSEFGRRVGENNSLGTDHGAGNSLFVMGGQIQGGVYGGQPDLQNLLKGSLVHTIDFRSVYSRVIQDWLDTDPEPIFGTADFNDPVLDIQGGMDAIPLFKTAPSAAEGDVNGDGRVDAVDLQRVINSAIGRDSEGSSDVNNDGRIDAVDIQLVINAVLRKGRAR